MGAATGFLSVVKNMSVKPFETVPVIKGRTNKVELN